MKRATLAGLLLALSVCLLNVSCVMATEGLATDRADPLQPATLALLQGITCTPGNLCSRRGLRSTAKLSAEAGRGCWPR